MCFFVGVPIIALLFFMNFFPPALDDRLYSYLQRHVNPLAFRLQQSPTRDYHPQIYHNNWHQDQVEPDSILHECIVPVQRNYYASTSDQWWGHPLSR